MKPQEDRLSWDSILYGLLSQYPYWRSNCCPCCMGIASYVQCSSSQHSFRHSGHATAITHSFDCRCRPVDRNESPSWVSPNRFVAQLACRPNNRTYAGRVTLHYQRVSSINSAPILVPAGFLAVRRLLKKHKGVRAGRWLGDATPFSGNSTIFPAATSSQKPKYSYF